MDDISKGIRLIPSDLPPRESQEGDMYQDRDTGLIMINNGTGFVALGKKEEDDDFESGYCYDFRDGNYFPWSPEIEEEDDLLDEIDKKDGYKEDLLDGWEKKNEDTSIVIEFEKEECTCDWNDLLNYGCQCGAMKEERKRKNEEDSRKET